MNFNATTNEPVSAEDEAELMEFLRENMDGQPAAGTLSFFPHLLCG